MKETPSEYRERLLRTLGMNKPTDVLAETPKRLQKWMDEYPAEKWNRATTGVWSAAQVLSHLAEGELVFAYRLRIIARSSGANIQGFDQDAWVDECRYLIQNPPLALTLFQTIREANLAYIRSLPSSSYENYGIHSERGKETVDDLIRIYAGHDLNHSRQIEERLRLP